LLTDVAATSRVGILTLLLEAVLTFSEDLFARFTVALDRVDLG